LHLREHAVVKIQLICANSANHLMALLQRRALTGSGGKAAE